MNIRKQSGRLITALLLVVSTTATAQSVDEFRQVLTVHQQGGDGLQRVTLPPQVFEGATRTDLGDLRVFNAKGDRVPFAHASLAPTREVAARKELLTLFPQWRTVQSGATAGGLNLQVRQQADGTLISLTQSPTSATRATREVERYIVDASKLKSPVNALIFDWLVTPETQSGRVRIETSTDLKQWQTLVADAPLVELEHAGEKLVRNRVEFSPTEVRYLQITWRGRAFELRSLAAEIPAERLVPPLSRKRVTAVRGQEAGEFLFDLNGQPPIEQIALKLAENNSVAPARIFVRAKPADPWRPLTSATFYRLQREGGEIESPPIAVPLTQQRYWRVLLDARAGSSATQPELEVAWQPRSIVFVARGEGPYRVAWGHAEAKPEDLNIAQTIPDYKSFSEYSVPEARVDTLVNQVVGEPSAPQRIVRDVTRNITPQKLGLWLLLLGGVAVLGFMAWRLNAQLGKGESPTSKSDGKAG